MWSGSYQIVLVVELLLRLASKEKNRAGLPAHTKVKSCSQRRTIVHTSCEPSPGAERVQSSRATGGASRPDDRPTPLSRSTRFPPSSISRTS